MVAVCAPVQLDGKSDISVVAWRLEHCEQVTASAHVYRKRHVDIVAGREAMHICIRLQAGDDSFLVLAPF